MRHNSNHNRSAESHTSAKTTVLYPEFAIFARKTSMYCCKNIRFTIFIYHNFKEIEIKHLTLRKKSVSFTP